MTIKELYEYAKANGIENRPVVITGYDGDLDELTEDIIKEPSEFSNGFIFPAISEAFLLY
jgi:hypothetical protein